MSSAVGKVLTQVSPVGRAIFKALKPKVPVIPKVPQRGDVGQDDETRRKDRKRKGRKSTILTGVKSVIKPLGGRSDSNGQLG